MYVYFPCFFFATSKSSSRASSASIVRSTRTRLRSSCCRRASGWRPRRWCSRSRSRRAVASRFVRRSRVPLTLRRKLPPSSSSSRRWRRRRSLPPRRLCLAFHLAVLYALSLRISIALRLRWHFRCCIQYTVCMFSTLPYLTTLHYCASGWHHPAQMEAVLWHPAAVGYPRR